MTRPGTFQMTKLKIGRETLVVGAAIMALMMAASVPAWHANDGERLSATAVWVARQPYHRALAVCTPSIPESAPGQFVAFNAKPMPVLSDRPSAAQSTR